jgi:hypothetical protein
MVIVQCYHCSKILELDEGFRGGVCRCSDCGSLLQVPKAANASANAERARPAAPGAVITRPSSPNEIRRPEAPSGGSDPRSGIGSGMARPSKPMDAIEALAVATGSGGFAPSPTRPSAPRIEKVTPLEPAPGHPGSGSGISGMANAAARARQVKKNRTTLFVFLGLGGVILIIGIVVIIAIAGSGDPKPKPADNKSGSSGATPPNMNTNTGMQPVAPPPTKTPAVGFFGMKLTGKKIVISIDSGGSMGDNFDFVTAGAMKAIQQLESNQQVKIVVWGSPPLKIPDGNAFAKKGDNVFKKLENTYSSAGGQDEVSNVNETLKAGGDQTIFITAKLDFKEPVATAARKSGQRVDVLWISSGTDDDNAFKKLSKSSGGTFTIIGSDKIKDYYK